MEVVNTVPGLLAGRAAAEPDHVALLLNGERALTLGQWHRQADAVARGLVAKGVRRGDRVTLRFTGEEWLEYAVAFVAVTAAGATAIPLSPSLPQSRIDEVIAHCRAAHTLDASGLVAGESELPEVEPGDLAQIIYTSGTTGAPKGVYASHDNLTHGLGRLAHSRHVVHAFPMGTNAAQTMLVTALVSQPTVVVASKFDASGFAALVRRYSSETVFVVPAMAIALLEVADQLSSVELIASSAAPLPPAVALRLTEALPGVTIINSYTSTEAAPAFTSMVFDPARPTAVGRSRDVKVDDAGQVWLRSPFPRGYFGDSAATAATFRDGWVRTGDVGYLDTGGYLHLSGRASDEVKVAGHRVSTLRVENALYEHPAVVEAAVVGLPHPSLGTRLTATVVLREPVADLRSFLGERLAPHEIPTRIDVAGALPRNEMGKVLKGQLAALSAVWQELLGVAEAGADDDFFTLGGDSLSAARLADRLGIPLKTVFENPTLCALAAHVREVLPEAEAVPDLVKVELTATQESLLAWMHETDPPRDAGPVSVGIRIRDEFDPGLFEQALAAVIARHDALRMVFPGGRPRVLAHCPPSVRLVDTPEEVLYDREGRFDLEHGPLVRAAIARLGGDGHLLGLAVHHLVFDGASMGLLLHETGLAYSALRAGVALSLKPPPVDYHEHVAWTRNQWAGTIPYWTERLAGAPRALDLPARRPATRIKHGHLRFRLGSSAGLAEIRHAHHATTFMVIAACWATVLSRFAESDDLVLLVPMQGRLRPGSEQIIGCLVQSVLLRVDVAGDPSFAELLARVRKGALEAAEHQFHPFARFYRQHDGASFLRVERWSGPAHFPGLESQAQDFSRALDAEWPTPDGESDRQAPELAVVEQRDGSLEAWLLWNRYAFEPSTMDRMARMLTALVQSLPGQTGLRLSQLLPPEEEMP